jgi:hypothetical protein
MSDATGVAEAMLGLPGFRVLGVEESAAEVIIRIETSTALVGCPGCGVVATAHDRMVVDYRDLAACGRPARLVWAKRRWRCEEPACAMRTWTETSSAFSGRCLLTNRAGLECCLQVGLNARPVAQMARELGVSCDTVMAAVREHGEPLVDDPARVGEVTQLGVDETTWLAATKEHPTPLPRAWWTSSGGPSSTSWRATPAKISAPGSTAGPRPGAAGSGPWPRTWPSPTARAWMGVWITRCGWPTRSTWCACAMRRHVSGRDERTRLRAVAAARRS